MSRRFHTPIIIAALFAAFAPTAARADDSVLLSGYAPPAAGDQAILGVPASPSASPGASAAGSTAGASASGRRSMPLAQPVAAGALASRPLQVAAQRLTGRASRPHGSHGSAGPARTTGVSPSPSVAALPSAPPAVLAAARGSAGGIFSWWQGVLVGALALIIFGLARAWRREIQ